MAVKSGKDGKIVIYESLTETEITLCNEWTADFNTDIEEWTPFGGLWRRILALLNSVTANFNGKLDMGDTTGQKAMWDAQVALTAKTLRLYMDTTHYFTGSFFVKNFKPSVKHKGINSVGFSLEADGAVTYA